MNESASSALSHPLVVVMTGLPAAGKSHAIRECLGRSRVPSACISCTELRWRSFQEDERFWQQVRARLLVDLSPTQQRRRWARPDQDSMRFPCTAITLRRLEYLTRHVVLAGVHRERADHERAGVRRIFVETTPYLAESLAQALCGRLVVVTVDDKTRLRRLRARLAGRRGSAAAVATIQRMAYQPEMHALHPDCWVMGSFDWRSGAWPEPLVTLLGEATR